MPANQEVMNVARNVIKEDERAASAVAAMRQRGLSRQEAEKEIARVLVSCVSESVHGSQPPDFGALMDALKSGKTAAELFPDYA